MSTNYFARTLHGLEENSWHAVREIGYSELISISHRTIEFTSEASLIDLLASHGIEDLFIHLETIERVTHERSALELLRKAVRRCNLAKAVQALQTARPIPPKPAFSITASFVGSRNYNRWELADSIRAGIPELASLPYVETKDQSAPPHDLHLRLVIEGERAILGLRASLTPLHKRTYLQTPTPGSISPVAAFLMSRLANPKAGEVVLDPLCGCGTIPIEASFCAPNLVTMGMEIDPLIAEMGQRNAAAAGTGTAIIQGDIFKSSLEPGSTDIIVCDLPWGEQTTLKNGSYNSLLVVLKRLLRSQGRMVLMSGDIEALEAAVELSKLKVQQRIDVSLHGKHPRIILSRI